MLGAASDTLQVLLPAIRRELLVLFFLMPEESFHLRYLARRLKTGQGSLHRELEQLVKVGILSSERVERLRLYRVNPDGFLFVELRRIVEKTVGPVGRIREALLPLAARIRVAFLHGLVPARASSLRGDVELVIIGDVTFVEVTEVLTRVEKELRREVNTMIHSPRQFRFIVRGSPLLKSILAGPMDFALGDAHLLESLIRGPSRDGHHESRDTPLPC